MSSRLASVSMGVRRVRFVRKLSPRMSPSWMMRKRSWYRSSGSGRGVRAMGSFLPGGSGVLAEGKSKKIDPSCWRSGSGKKSAS